MPYLGRSSNFGVRTVFQYLPSAGDTSVSGADANGKTLAFADGNYVDVYLNGVKLKTGTDYNTTTANTIAGLTALASNDEVTVVVYDAFSLATGFETLGGTFGDDITFNKDGVVLNFGADSDVTITHDPDDGLIFKSAATGDDNPFLLTLQTGETDIAANDVLGAINFQAPDEGTGTDAILVAAGIEAVSEGDFSSSSNATKLVFKTGASAVADSKFEIASDGSVSTPTAGTNNLRLGANAGNSIASGGNENTLIGDEAGTALTTGDQNVAIGFEALKTEDAHGRNTAIGYQALKVLDAGANGFNTVIGYQAGVSMNTGTVNTIIGHQAGDALTTGNNNVAIGHEALGAEVQGDQNVAVGVGALQSQSNSTDVNAQNTAVGYNAGLSITTGVENTFVGATAGDATTDADFNVGIGWGALGANTVGSKSVAVGVGTLDAQNPTTATDMHNTAIGHGAGGAVTTGRFNNLMGSGAGDALTSANSNIAIGYNTLTADTLGDNSVAIGDQALATQNFTTSTDSFNVAIGSLAGTAITTGVQNVVIGGQCGDALTDADENVAMGHGTLSSDTLGSKSTALGYNALNAQNFTTATNSLNVAVGYYAGLSVTTGTENTIAGANAGDAITTSQGNVAIGSQALSEQAGDFNTAVGRQACNGVTSSGNRNTGIGEVALFSVNSGAKNVGLGNAAGYAITSGGNNICLGVDAGRTGSPGGNITTGSNEIALGDENISSFSCQVSLTATSDERDKTDFKDLDLGLDFVNALKPVTYVWDKRTNYIDKTDVTTYDEDGKIKHEGWDLTTDLDKVTSDGSKKDDDLQVGFKAQDVIALEDAAGYKLSDKTNLTATVTSDGKQYGLRYERFVPMLVKALQELSAKNDALEARIKTLEDA